MKEPYTFRFFNNIFLILFKKLLKILFYSRLFYYLCTTN